MYLGTVTSGPKRRDRPLQLLSRGMAEVLSIQEDQRPYLGTWAYPGESEALSWAYLGVGGLILGLSRRVRGPILGLPRGVEGPILGLSSCCCCYCVPEVGWGRRPYLGPILGGLRSYLLRLLSIQRGHSLADV